MSESLNQRGVTIWLTGLPSAGKSTISQALEKSLRAEGRKVEVLDGDNVRSNLSKGLGYSKEDRDTNVRRIGFVANLLSRNGIVAIVAAISPYRQVRDEIRETIGDFIEVFVDCPLEILISRDSKGMYKKALTGEISNFTGVSDPYEHPLNPELVLQTGRESVEESRDKVMCKLAELGYIDSWDRSPRADSSFRANIPAPGSAAGHHGTPERP